MFWERGLARTQLFFCVITTSSLSLFLSFLFALLFFSLFFLSRLIWFGLVSPFLCHVWERDWNRLQENNVLKKVLKTSLLPNGTLFFKWKCFWNNITSFAYDVWLKHNETAERGCYFWQSASWNYTFGVIFFVYF